MNLPVFKYHPDPIATGSVVRSATPCICCEQDRGYVYVGNIYCEDDLEECLCPWCIHEGKAHVEFDAEFTDSAGVGDGELAEEVIEEVAYRTPGFSGWQQEQWLSCCDDAAAFLGIAGREELQSKWPEAIEAVQAEVGLEGEEWDAYFHSLSVDEGPTAYIFRCLHCGKLLAYSDCN